MLNYCKTFDNESDFYEFLDELGDMSLQEYFQLFPWIIYIKDEDGLHFLSIFHEMTFNLCSGVTNPECNLYGDDYISFFNENLTQFYFQEGRLHIEVKQTWSWGRFEQEVVPADKTVTILMGGQNITDKVLTIQRKMPYTPSIPAQNINYHCNIYTIDIPLATDDITITFE